VLTAQACRMARAALDIGLRDLAVAADISPNTVARLERGETMHRRTLAHVQAVFEALGVVFVSDGTTHAWPGPVVGAAPKRKLAGRAKLISDLWTLPRLRQEPEAAYGALLAIFEAYLDIIETENREPDTWERLKLAWAVRGFARSDVYSALAAIHGGVTPPDNQGKDYPIGPKDEAALAPCNLAHFRKASATLRARGYIEPYPKSVS
jgi:transcriptional regulator with XRE-family HTH domain